MPILHLDDEQIRTWSREQKDRWWLDNVYRHDMPQLTLRSGLTLMALRVLGDADAAEEAAAIEGEGGAAELALADAVNARCCVDIAGSFHDKVWYGAHPKNFSREFFDAAVEDPGREASARALFAEGPFDLAVVRRYFPEFETELRRRLGG